MAEGVDAHRKAVGNLAARQVGLRLGQPNLTVDDMKLLGAGNQSEVLSLPVDGSKWSPLQDIDPTSPTLGMLYFVPDVDVPGDPNRIISPYTPGP